MSIIAIVGMAFIMILGNALCILADYRLAAGRGTGRDFCGDSQQVTEQQLTQAVSDAQADIMAQYILERRGNRL